MRCDGEAWDAQHHPEPRAPGQPGEPAEPGTAMIRRPAAVPVEDAQGTEPFAATGHAPSQDASFVSGTRDAWLLPPELVSPVDENAGRVSRRPAAAKVMPSLIIGELVRTSDFAGREGRESVVSPGRLHTPTVVRAPLVGEGRCTVRTDVATGICTGSQWLEGPPCRARASATHPRGTRIHD